MCGGVRVQENDCTLTVPEVRHFGVLINDCQIGLAGRGATFASFTGTAASAGVLEEGEVMHTRVSVVALSE